MNRKVVLAFSGGLDTSYALVALRENGWEVVTATVNTGGIPSSENDAIAARAAELGTVRHHTVDAREELFDSVIAYAIKANYLRNGGYPSCVGAERMVQAEKVVEIARKEGADAIAHGSTGAGADHVRYDSVIRAYAPKLEIISLTRDEQLTRETEAEFLRKREFSVSDKIATYSINESLLGTTIGGGATYGSWEYLPDDAWTYTKSLSDAPDEPSTIVIEFDRGVPVSCINLETLEPIPGVGPEAPNYAILESLNALGGQHGIGRGIHMGSTMVGNLARVGFEAPGMLILIAAHRELERLVLTNRQQAIKSTLGTTYGDLLHEAIYFDPIMDDLRAYLDSSQSRVTGRVRLQLFKGNTVLLGTDSPFSLLDASARNGVVYGYGSSNWSGAEARAFAHLYSMGGAIAHLAGLGSRPEPWNIDKLTP